MIGILTQALCKTCVRESIVKGADAKEERGYPYHPKKVCQGSASFVSSRAGKSKDEQQKHTISNDQIRKIRGNTRCGMQAKRYEMQQQVDQLESARGNRVTALVQINMLPEAYVFETYMASRLRSEPEDDK